MKINLCSYTITRKKKQILHDQTPAPIHELKKRKKLGKLGTEENFPSGKRNL